VLGDVAQRQDLVELALDEHRRAAGIAPRHRPGAREHRLDLALPALDGGARVLAGVELDVDQRGGTVAHEVRAEEPARVGKPQRLVL
jgi:hypothetical protein